MHNLSKPRHVTVLIALSAMLMLASCAKKEDQTASAPSAAPSAAPSPASPASPATSPSSPTSTSMGTPSNNSKPAVSASAQKLGVKPTDATTCPTNAPVKGNVTKKRGELYFTAKFPDYKTVKPEICFKDTATAEKAGFRAPKAQ
jgi:pyruvate/2-oxoglutarate dehydrogenase complex dihydrolipoamide acyltransferase (E2) component